MKKFVDQIVFRVLDWLTNGCLTERDRLRVQLAGISVVAAGQDLDLPETAWGWSPAFEDVRKLWIYTYSQIRLLEQVRSRQSFEIDEMARWIKSHEHEVENLRNRLNRYQHIDEMLRRHLKNANVSGKQLGLLNTGNTHTNDTATLTPTQKYLKKVVALCQHSDNVSPRSAE